METEPNRFLGEGPCQMENCTAKVNLQRTHFCLIHRFCFALFPNPTFMLHYP